MNFNDVQDLELSEEFYTTQALKSAVWQFLMDHCYGRMTDEFHVRFFVPSEQEFWRRVSARKYGKYKAHDLKSVYEKSLKKFKCYNRVCARFDELQRREDAVYNLKDGDFLDRIRFFMIMSLRNIAHRLSPKPTELSTTTTE